MSAAALAAAAEALVGARFRLHGRDPATGLDCIGVLAAALARIGRQAPIPTGYPLRLRQLGPWLPDPDTCGFIPAPTPETQPGDVQLLGLAGGQFHLAIAVSGSQFVHAHAGLRRIVLTPACPAGDVVGHWRLPDQRT